MNNVDSKYTQMATEWCHLGIYILQFLYFLSTAWFCHLSTILRSLLFLYSVTILDFL